MEIYFREILSQWQKIEGAMKRNGTKSTEILYRKNSWGYNIVSDIDL